MPKDDSTYVQRYTSKLLQETEMAGKEKFK